MLYRQFQILFLCFLLTGPVMGQVNLWTHTDEQENESEGKAIVGTETYKMVVGGTFKNSFSTGGFSVSVELPGNSYFLMETDIEGEIYWLKHFASSAEFKVKKISSDNAHNLFLLAELNGFVTYGNLQIGEETTDEEPLLIKLDAKGNYLWHKFLKEPGNSKLKIKGFDVSSSGEIFMAAELKEYVTIEGQQFGPQGKENILLLKFSDAGQLLQHHQITSPYKVKPEALKITRTGKIYLSGVFDGKLNFNSSFSISGKSKEAFIARLNSNFEAEWAFAKFSGPKGYKIKAIEEDNQQNILVAGEFEISLLVDETHKVESISKSKDALLIKFSSAGNILWMHNVNPLDEAEAKGIKVDKNNNIYLYGEYKQGFRYGYQNENPLVTTCKNASKAKGAFLAKYSPEGKVMAAKSISGVNEAKIGDLFIDFKNDLYVTGNYKGSLALDTVNLLTSSSQKCFYLAKIDLHSCTFIYDYSQDFINKDVVFLHQNFPNPTSGETYIHFHVAKEVPVRIQLYDFSGRAVDTVFEEAQTKVANYVFPYIFPDRCSSGIYMLVLESGDRRLTKKIMLQK